MIVIESYITTQIPISDRENLLDLFLLLMNYYKSLN